MPPLREEAINSTLNFLSLVEDEKSEFYVPLSNVEKIVVAHKLIDIEKFHGNSAGAKANSFEKEAAVLFGIKPTDTTVVLGGKTPVDSDRDETWNAFIQSANEKGIVTGGGEIQRLAYKNCVYAYREVLGIGKK